MARHHRARRRPPQSPPPPILLALGLRDVAAAIGVSLATVQREIARGRLAAIKVGARTVVLRGELDRYLAARPPAVEAAR